MDSTNNIAAIDKAMLILKTIKDAASPMGVSQISKTTGLPKTTAFRILRVLLGYQLVSINDNDEYFLGTLFIGYGEAAKCNYSIRSIVKPHLKKLSEETGEATNLGIRDHDTVLNILNFPGETSIFLTNLTAVSPLHCSAMGKILLSTLPEADIKAYFSSKSESELKRTVSSISSFNEFMESIKDYYETGISWDNEEYDYGLFCIGVPIYDSSDNIVAGISLSGPKSRMELKGLEFLKPKLKLTGERISDDLKKAYI